MLITIYVRAPRLCTVRVPVSPQESDGARGRRSVGAAGAWPPRVAHALLPLRGRARSQSSPDGRWRSGAACSAGKLGDAPDAQGPRRLARDGHAPPDAAVDEVVLRSVIAGALFRPGTSASATDPGQRLHAVYRGRAVPDCSTSVRAVPGVSPPVRSARPSPRRRGHERRGDLGRLVRRVVDLRQRHAPAPPALRAAGTLRRAHVRDARHARTGRRGPVLHADRSAGMRRRAVRSSRARPWSRCRCPTPPADARGAATRATAPRPCTRRSRRPRRRRSGRRRRRPSCRRPAPSRTAGGWSR